MLVVPPQIHPAWGAHKDDQCQDLSRAQGTGIPVEIETGRLHDPAALMGVRDLIQVEFEYFRLGEAIFQSLGFDSLEPAGPERAGTWMEHAHHLLGNGARPPHHLECPDILHRRVKPGHPVHPPVPVEAPVLRLHKGLQHQGRDFMQGKTIVEVPAVLVGDGKRCAVAVQDLEPLDLPGFRSQLFRNRQQVRPGPKDQKHHKEPAHPGKGAM